MILEFRPCQIWVSKKRFGRWFGGMSPIQFFEFLFTLPTQSVESHYSVWADVCQRFRKIIQTSVMSRSRGSFIVITPRSFDVITPGNFCNRVRTFASVFQRSIYRGELLLTQASVRVPLANLGQLS